MKLAISNIAWDFADDAEMLAYISDKGFSGIEIAPTRVIKENPYDHLEKAKDFYLHLKEKNLEIPSMQSIWFGRAERVLFDKTERQALAEYTKKAIDFAEAIRCGNLVFGSPKNRVLEDAAQREAGLAMMTDIAKYAAKKGTVVAIEANPTIYNTNFINQTQEAFALAKEIDLPGFKVNVDIGTMIENDEKISIHEENMDLINHIHVSEPYLAVPEKRRIHQALAALLKANDYRRFVSIVMKNPGDIETVKQTMTYVKEVLI